MILSFCRPCDRIPIALMVVILLGISSSARAGSLTINPTFDPSQTWSPDQETAINAAISNVTANITSSQNLSVTIFFTQTPGEGLGGSSTGLVGETYSDYYNALSAVSGGNSVLQTALGTGGSLPAPVPDGGNPVNNGYMAITTAEARNLGFSASGYVNGTYDSEIFLNTDIAVPPGQENGSNYSLQSVANHEIDEALGIGGTGSTLGRDYSPYYVGDLDLYRYSSSGVRSFTTSSEATAYFSINNGTTDLTGFNQAGGGSDYSDWAGTGTPQVQDAFGTPGSSPTLGTNEITALEAIGYEGTSQGNPVPEPASVTLMGMGGLLFLGFGLWARKRAFGAASCAA